MLNRSPLKCGRRHIYIRLQVDRPPARPPDPLCPRRLIATLAAAASANYFFRHARWTKADKPPAATASFYCRCLENGKRPARRGSESMCHAARHGGSTLQPPDAGEPHALPRAHRVAAPIRASHADHQIPAVAPPPHTPDQPPTPASLLNSLAPTPSSNFLSSSPNAFLFSSPSGSFSSAGGGSSPLSTSP
jgi:hypothetical protein